MAGSFAAAFNKALGKAFDRSVGIREKRTRKRTRELPTWQESRATYERNLERTKARIKQPEDNFGLPEIKRESAEYKRGRAAGASEELVRQTEFEIVVNDDPAFMAWVNRVGAQANAPIYEGQEITQARLNYLIEEFGVKDALELYEFVTNDPDFGYDDFQWAYTIDGKNAHDTSDGAYKINRAVSMHMAQVQLFEDYPIYELIAA